MSSKKILFLDSNILYLRKTARLSQRELAKLIGVRTNTISHYERGKSAPNFLLVHKLMMVFEVSSDDLLYSELSKNHPAEHNATSKPEKEVMKSMDALIQNDRINSNAIQTHKNDIYELKLQVRELNKEIEALKELMIKIRENI